MSVQPNSRASTAWCFTGPDVLTSIGDSIPPGRYFLHSAFRRVANYTGESGLVSLVDQSTGAGPYNIVFCTGGHDGPTEWPGKVDINDGIIRFDGEPVKIQGIDVFDSSVQSLIMQYYNQSYKSYKSYKSYLSYQDYNFYRTNRTYKTHRTNRSDKTYRS